MADMLAGQVRVPLAGEVKKKTVALVIAGGLVLAAIYYVRNRNAVSAAPGSGAADSALAQDQGAANAIDPATGFIAGSPEDLAALQQLDSTTAGSQFSGSGSGSFGNGQPPVPSPGTGFPTNAAWAQAAEDYLVNQTGANPETVGNALGKYITGSAVTDSQELVVNQAITFENYPPISGPGGYPPNIKKATSGGGSGPKTAANPVGDLRVSQVGFTSVDLTWHRAANATDYLVTVTEDGKTIKSQKTPGTHIRIGGLKRKTHYNFRVRAQPGVTGGHDANVMATTR